jgi:tubulin--tyrosine ligase
MADGKEQGRQQVAAKRFWAQIDYEDSYVQPLILQALRSQLPSELYEIVTALPAFDGDDRKFLQIRQYESLAFDLALQRPNDILINAYIIRKALVRKHFLAATISSWITKRPGSMLKNHVKQALEFELDYAEFLDEALAESYELRDSLAKNEPLEADHRQWWILKPSMSDQGQGLRLFSTEEELAAIFEEWEEGLDSDDDSKAVDVDDPSNNVIASQLRHFVAQEYVHPPLLLPSASNHKFHVRTYVLAVGALAVYVYRPMLALFAADAYEPPWESLELGGHLTNTCFQGGDVRDGTVRQFWDLDDEVPGLPADWKDKAFSQICAISGETFEAAARNMMVHFQVLPCSFEVFGVDFLIDAEGNAWLLEINAFPDFKQTGDELKPLVQGLWEEVFDVAVRPFFDIPDIAVGGQGLAEPKAKKQRLAKVLDIDLGRK